MKFTLTVSDEDGQLSGNVNFHGGYDVRSGAHQIGRILVNHLDSILEKKEVSLDGCESVVDVEGVPV